MHHQMVRAWDLTGNGGKGSTFSQKALLAFPDLRARVTGLWSGKHVITVLSTFGYPFAPHATIVVVLAERFFYLFLSIVFRMRWHLAVTCLGIADRHQLAADEAGWAPTQLARCDGDREGVRWAYT